MAKGRRIHGIRRLVQRGLPKGEFDDQDINPPVRSKYAGVELQPWQ
jgi:hypothetical protein